MSSRSLIISDFLYIEYNVAFIKKGPIRVLYIIVSFNFKKVLLSYDGDSYLDFNVVYSFKADARTNVKLSR